MRKIGAFCLFCFLILSCSTKKDDAGDENVSTVLPDEIDEVRVFRLEYSDFRHELVANGFVSAQNKADLRFQSSETVTDIYVKNGDRVEKGQKIAALDAFKLKNSLAQAKDQLERARLDLQDVLIGQGFSPNDTASVPKDVMRLAKVKSNYDQSLNQYALAEYNLFNAILYAPFNGIVANLFAKAFNIPAATEPFCTIIDNNRLEVEFKVLESEIAMINIGDRAVISPFSIVGFSCEGRVSEINPAVDKNGMTTVKAIVAAAQNRLYDGMNVKVNLQRSLGSQLVIPKDALVLRTNKKVVFTLKDGRAQWHYVQTTLENSFGYVVSEGLSEGDSVIFEGNINLAHETPVVLKR
ncbi:MAG: efflux RND transporter periplasmic adaptor subunit [Tannerellaceae bacterium]|jgi:RND family efflux transporter MFP subunit|nr:efflux RND transporter periplasmic adaptor subunit [Tannerellaceae bacterium]